MELAIRDLKLNDATEVMDYYGEDPFQMIQVHDYLNVSFFRMGPAIQTASRQIIEVFSMAYPELLKEKYFVNVPAIMEWVFTAMKVFLSKATIRKFHPVSNGANLAREFSGFGDEIPKSYGGKGGELAECSRTVNLEDEVPQSTTISGASATAASEKNRTPILTEAPSSIEAAELTEKTSTVAAPETTSPSTPEIPVAK